MSDDEKEAPMLHLPLGESGHLTFCPHAGGATATFDVSSANGRPDVRLPPDWAWRRWTGLCCNITRDEATVLRDALNAWLSS